MSDTKEKVILTDEIRTALAPEFEKLESKAKAAGIDEGIKTERARVISIDSLAIPGHEKLVAEMKADGTTETEAMRKLLDAEKTKRKDTLASLREDGKEVAAVATSVSEPAKKEEDKGKKIPTDEKEMLALTQKLAGEATTYIKEQAVLGKTISVSDATIFVYQRAGVPLR